MTILEDRFTRLSSRKYRLIGGDGVLVVMPCDKKTWRVVDKDGDALDASKYRNLVSAMRAAVLV